MTSRLLFSKGLSITDIQPRGSYLIANSKLFVAKNIRYFLFRSNKVEGSADILWTRGMGQFFTILSERLSWSAPYQKSQTFYHFFDDVMIS